MGYIYHFTCGCSNTRSSMINRDVRCCADHQTARVSKITFVCESCGEETGRTNNGALIKMPTQKTLCEKCKKKKISIQRAASNREYKKTYKDRKKFLIRQRQKKKQIKHETKPDCKFYLEKCLPAVCRDPKVEYVQCYGCTRYEKQELRLEDYMTCDTCGFEEAKNAFNIRVDLSEKWVVRGASRRTLRKERTKK